MKIFKMTNTRVDGFGVFYILPKKNIFNMSKTYQYVL